MDIVDFPDFYRILGIDCNASLATIKQKYHQLSLQYHPDKNQSKDSSGNAFVKVNEAFKVLTEPKLKQEYDLQYVAHTNRSAVAIHDQVSLDELEFDGTCYVMRCRCGGVFFLTKEASELPLSSLCVSCDTCSLCISVSLQ